MATSINSVSSAVQSGFAQLKLQQAQRNAERAEQTAQALAQQASAAQGEANRAQENARAVTVQADQAQGEAGQARMGLSAIRSATQAVTRLGNTYDRVAEAMSAADAAPSAAPVSTAAASSSAATSGSEPKAVVNSQGQTTGTLIDVKA